MKEERAGGGKRESGGGAQNREREGERQERCVRRVDRERSVQNIVCSLEYSQCTL